MMQSLGLADDRPSVVDAGGRTQAEIASELQPYIQRAVTGAKWIFVILSSTALNAVLYMVGIPVHFIFGMAIPLFLQIFGSNVFTHNLIWMAIIAWLLAAGIYTLFIVLWRVALTGKAWPGCVVLPIYAFDFLMYLRQKNWLEVACHLFAMWFIVNGVIGATMLRRTIQNLRASVPSAAIEPVRESAA
jgi:hypothetical protein